MTTTCQICGYGDVFGKPLVSSSTVGAPFLLLALPIAAVVRQTVVYLRRHLVLEPWGTLGSGVISNVGVDRCAECGAPASPRDSYCRSCGSSLGERVQMPS